MQKIKDPEPRLTDVIPGLLQNAEHRKNARIQIPSDPQESDGLILREPDDFSVRKLTGHRVHPRLFTEHQLVRCLNLPHRCPERQKRKFCDLEELPAEGNSDDCDAAQNADYGIADCHRDSRHNQPDDVCKQADRPATVHNFLPKWKECQSGKLEALQADWYPDDGDAPQAPCRKPCQPAQKSAADKPQYVSQYAHE